MSDDATQNPDRQFAEIAAALDDELVTVLPKWLEEILTVRAPAAAIADVDACIDDVLAEMVPALHESLTADVDALAANPLEVIRRQLGPATAFLQGQGVAPAVRDPRDVELLPDDVYGIAPARFDDIDDSLTELGLMWGAARAHVHLARRRAVDELDDLGSAAVTTTDFSSVLSSVSDVEGWMTDEQAHRLYDQARQLGAGDQVVEIGSFRGRSLIVLASAAPDGVSLVSIDPHIGSDRGPQEIDANEALGDDDNSVYEANLARAGVRDRIRHVRKLSDDALGDVDGRIELLYIDGAHRFAPARADIVNWGNRVPDGSVMLIHDSFSSIGVTLALMTTTFLSRRWRYEGRSQSMAQYRRVKVGRRGMAENLASQSAQLPWFVRNVIIKVLLTARLGFLTPLLGHRSRDWPY